MIESLFPFFGSIFIMLLFRRFDRNNVNMKKIKRLIELGEKELNHIVLLKKEELKDKTAEFKLLTFDLDKYIQKLKVESSETKQSLQEIQQGKQHFKEIQSDLDALEKVTQSVQSQLIYIKDSLHKVDAHHKKVKKLETRLDTVDEQANRMLNSFKEAIENKAIEAKNVLEDRFKYFATHFESYQKQIKEETIQRTELLDNEIQNKFQEMGVALKNQSEKVHQEICTHLQSSHDKIYSINEQTENLKSQLEVNLPKVLLEFKNEISVKADESSRKLDLLNTEIIHIDNLYKNKYNTLTQDLELQKTSLFDNLKETASKIRDDIQRLDLDAMSKKDELLSALRKEASTVEEKLERFNFVYEESKEKLIEDATNYYQEITDKINNLHEDRSNNFDKDFNKKIQIITNLTEQLEKDSEIYQKQYESFTEQSSEKYEGILVELEEARGYLYKEALSSKENLNQQTKTIQESLEQHFQEYVGFISEQKGALRNIVEEYKEILTNQLDEGESLLETNTSNHINTMKQKVDLYQSALLDRCELVTEEFQKQFQDSLKQIDLKESSIDTCITNWEDTIENLIQEAKESILKVKSEISISLQNGEDKFKDQFEKYVGFIKDRVEKVELFINKQQDIFRNTCLVAETQIREGLDDSLTILKENSNVLDTELNQKNNILLSKLEKQYREYTDSLKEKITKFHDTYINDTSEAIAQIENKEITLKHFIEKWQANIESLSLDTKEFIQSGKKDLEKQREFVIDTNEKSLIQASQYHKEKLSEIENLIKQHEDNLQNEFNSIKTSLLNYGHDCENKLELQSNESINVLKERIDKFSNLYTNDTTRLLKQIDDKESSLKQFAETWESRLETLASETKDSVHKGKLDLENQRIELLESNERALTDIFNNYKEKTDQRINSLYELKRDLEAKQNTVIDELKKHKVNFESDVKNLVQSQLESFENITEEKIEKTSRDFKDLSLKSTENLRKDVDTAIQKFVEYQREQESTLNTVQIETQRAEEEITSLQKAIKQVKDETYILETSKDRITETKEVMNDLTKKMDMVHNKNKELKDLYARMDELKDVRVKLEAEISVISSKEEKINQVHDQLNLMVKIKEELENRNHSLVQLKSLVDRLLTDEDKLDSQQNKLNAILDEFANHQEMLSATIKTIQEQDNSLKNIQSNTQVVEQALKKLDIKSQNITSHIDTISTQLLSIEKSDTEINFIKEKFMEIEDLVEDIDRRKNQIENLRHKYENLRSSMSTDLNQMEKIEQNAEEKVKKLSDIVNAIGGVSVVNNISSDTPKNINNSTKSGIKPTTNDVIIRLGQMGWTAEQINEKIKVDLATVQAILSTSSAVNTNR